MHVLRARPLSQTLTSKQANKLHVEDGFIPILYWSAESNILVSHQSPVEDLKWMPKNVWVSIIYH